MEFKTLGADWLADQVESITDTMTHETPTQYNERVRYLPSSVTSKPGYIRYDVNPYMREIVDCFDVNDPVREISLKKGVQITYTTALESGILYFADYIGTLPMMYMTADKELATARVENNIIVMFNQSDLGHIIKSSDEGNSRKTGKTKDHLQFAKGGYLVPFGAKNADKMRSYSIAIMLKDEIDAWPITVGKDGDPDALSDARTDGYTEVAKIFRGSTPLVESSSKIQKNFLRGDQRVYRIVCRACGFPQALRWHTVDKQTGVVGGFLWDTNDGTLVIESVRYACQNCGHEYHEHDKTSLFATENGAHWHPTAKPENPFVRSYHLPALYSPVGFKPWWGCVADYLKGFDPASKKVIDIGKYQVFYNNILAEPFKVLGDKVRFEQVSNHRRIGYSYGQIPNKYAVQHAGSEILFLMCLVDVHKTNLAVGVFGFTKGFRVFLIDYWRFEDEDCTELTSPVWVRLQQLIEEKVYTADDGREYGITQTMVDAGYANDTVTSFCANYASGVIPILGRERPAKNQRISEFAEFTTQAGTIGYRILVDHYKDRIATVLRREWVEEAGPQSKYHFNTPVDATTKQLKELTAETRMEKVDDKGGVTYVWHRPGNARNELWDLLGYAHAGVEIYAWLVCIKHYKLDAVDFDQFWEYCYQNVIDESASGV